MTLRHFKHVWVNLFSECSPIDPGRLASTLFVRCILYYKATLPTVDGLSSLPPGMDHLSEEAKIALDERIGLTLNSLRRVPLEEGSRERELGRLEMFFKRFN